MKTTSTTGMKRAAALLASAVVGISSFCNSFATWAEDETAEPVVINIIFDIEEGTDYAKDTSAEDFATYQVDLSQTDRLRLPAGKLKKGNLIFSGWTVDGLYGYTNGSVFLIPDGTTEDIVFKPCYFENSAAVPLHKINYEIIIDGESQDISERVEKTQGRPGQLVLPDYTRFTFDTCSSRGWTDGTHTFDNGQYIVMPDHDINLTGIIQQNVHYTYLAGDVEGLNGMTEFVSPLYIEGFPNELCAKDRFSRNGYYIVGWESSLDGNIYKPLQTVITPGQDVTFTAVWEPVVYPVTFNPLDATIGNTVINAPTGTTITIPPMEGSRDGYVFTGWKYSRTGDIYQPGDEFVVPALMSGQKQTFSAVWKVGTAEPATEAPTEAPTEEITEAPTEEVTEVPTEEATELPIEEATEAPTAEPTAPVEEPTEAPTGDTTEEPTGEVSTLSGDVNLDGKITVSDAVGVLQFIANKEKYALKGQALENADCDGTDGITGGDAVAIQKRDAGLVDSLPLKADIKE